MMLTINDRFPDFDLKVAKQGNVVPMSSEDFKGSWTIIFFYPEDFSFICPTEVTGFEKQREYLQDMDAQLIGISVDDVETHIKWQDEVDVNYPLGSDVGGELSKKVGVLDTSDNRSHRKR